MKTIIAFTVAAFALGGCTIEQRGGELSQELHLPILYALWKTESYRTESGKPVCMVTTGYNGLTILQVGGGKNISVAARGERKLKPGGEFRVNVGGNYYRTSSEYFTDNDAARLAQDLRVGDKAYLEWSEKRITPQGMQRSGNIIKLEDFKPQYDACTRKLKGRKG